MPGRRGGRQLLDVHLHAGPGREIHLLLAVDQVLEEPGLRAHLFQQLIVRRQRLELGARRVRDVIDPRPLHLDQGDRRAVLGDGVVAGSVPPGHRQLAHGLAHGLGGLRPELHLEPAAACADRAGVELAAVLVVELDLAVPMELGQVALGRQLPDELPHLPVRERRQLHRTRGVAEDELGGMAGTKPEAVRVLRGYCSEDVVEACHIPSLRQGTKETRRRPPAGPTGAGRTRSPHSR